MIAAAVVVGVAAIARAVWLVARRRKRMYRPPLYPARVVDMPMLHVIGYSAGLIRGQIRDDVGLACQG